MGPSGLPEIALALVSVAVWVAFALMLIAAAAWDVKSLTIPNRLNGLLALTFLPAAALSGLSPLEAGLGVAGGAALLAGGLLFFALRWMGGGDVKLIAAAGLWLGLPAVPLFLLWTALAGGALALLLFTARRLTPQAAVQGAPRWAEPLLTRKGPVPYGVAIAAGALAAYPHSLLARGLAGFA